MESTYLSIDKVSIILINIEKKYYILLLLLNN